MNRQLGLTVAAGLLAALLFLSLAKGIALGFVFSYVAPLPLMMAGLAFGTGASAIAGAVAAAAVGVGVGGYSALIFAVAAWLPALVVAGRANLWRTAEDGSTQWYPPGLILAWLTACGLALMMIGAALVAGGPDGVQGWITQMISQALELLTAEISAEMRERTVGWWTPFFPAMVVSSWLLMTTINAVAAQGMLVRLGRNRRPRPVYRQIALPDWTAVVMVFAAAASQIFDGDVGYLAANAAAVLVIPFMFLGLAGIHCWVADHPKAKAVLGATYGLLIIFFVWAALIVAGLGMVRFWTMRFRRGDSGGGMEG